ncbi:flippase [Crateriforma conspicua]|uniref:Colanic acid exporter n=1 Tax=Crateriforma conspicua TaxID=2527996 RepID=A0A5C5Y6E6_9PLAN|nr:flippase [Crateriforma conspicua]TWT70519.1 colanic acid exporter [Crateriforma conspicua]
MQANGMSGNWRKPAANIAWLVIEKLYSLILSFVSGVYLARYMGASDFGLFNYSLAFVALFRVLATLGLEEIVVRELVQNPEQKTDTLGTAFALRTASSLATIVLILAIAPFARPGDPMSQWLISISSLAYIANPGTLIQRWNTSRVIAKYSVWSSQAALTLATAGKLLLVLCGSSLLWFAWTNVMLAWLNSLLLLVFFLHSGESVYDWSFRLETARNLLRDAWPRIPSGIASTLQNQAGALLIGSMVGDKELGVYSVALRIFLLLIVFPSAICQTLSPNLTKARKISHRNFIFELTNMYRLVIQLFILTTILVLVFGTDTIRLLFGNEYAAAGTLLNWMLLPCFILFVGAARLWFIIIENLLLYSMLLGITQSIVTTIAYYIAVSQFGSLGAIIGLGIGGTFAIAIDLLHPTAKYSTKSLIDAMLSIWELPRRHPAKGSPKP